MLTCYQGGTQCKMIQRSIKYCTRSRTSSLPRSSPSLNPPPTPAKSTPNITHLLLHSIHHFILCLLSTSLN